MAAPWKARLVHDDEAELATVVSVFFDSRSLISAWTAKLAGVGMPSSAPRRTTRPFRESISVRLPRATSCAVEEVASTLNDLVREGKILHYGFSDTPAWYVARAYTLAEKEGKDRVAALQLEYSLVERNIEREHIPVAQELGLAV